MHCSKDLERFGNDILSPKKERVREREMEKC
jgi:hypothetical protein